MIDDDATHEPSDEVLDSRPEPRHRAWWALGGVAVVAVVAAIVAYAVSQDSAGDRATPTPTSVAARPLTPDYSTLSAAPETEVDLTPAFRLCPAECARSATSAHATAVIRARLDKTFGDVSGLSIATYAIRVPLANGRRPLYSRIVQAHVPAGDLKILVTLALGGSSADLSLPGRPGTSQIGVEGVVSPDAVLNYTTKTVLRFGPDVAVPRAVSLIHRISGDATLVTV